MFLQRWDDWLITNIFEPIAWWSEYRFGVGGLKIYLYLYMTVFTAFGMLAYDQGNYVLVCIDVGLVLFQVQTFPSQEATIRRNKGLNQNRVFWPMRVTLCACIVVILMLTWLEGAPYELREMRQDFLLGLLLVAIYFGSCNAMPPGFEERYLLPRTI
jgi:hypothetical protein